MISSDRRISPWAHALLGACLAAALGLAQPALGAESATGAKADAEEKADAGDKSGGKVMIQYAPNAIHWNYDVEHAKQSWLVGAEYIWKSNWLVGFSYFNNSFNQKCQLVYGGYSWKLFGTPKSHAYLKVGGGLIIKQDSGQQQQRRRARRPSGSGLSVRPFQRADERARHRGPDVHHRLRHFQVSLRGARGIRTERTVFLRAQLRQN